MTILYVNTGSSANKGDGDTLRTAFGKINYNFSQLVGLIGDSSATITVNSFPPLDPAPGSVWFDTVSGRTFIYYDSFWVDANPPAVNPIPWNTVSTHIIPSSNLTFNLGTTGTSWQNLYAGTVRADYISSNTSSYVSMVTSNNSSWRFNSDNKLISSQTGRPNGYLNISTSPYFNIIELVPDEFSYSANRYLVVDPGIDGNIHLRAGGDLDINRTTFVVGSRKSNVTLRSDGSVFINAYAEDTPTTYIESQWRLRSDGSIVLPRLVTTNSGHLFTSTEIVLSSNDKRWIFNATGDLTAPGNLIPNSDLAYDLGSTSSQWRSLYIGTSTIYLGGTALSVSGGTLTIDGSPVQGGGAASLSDRITSSTYSVIIEGNTGTVSIPNAIISQGNQLGLAGSQNSYNIGRYLRVRDGDFESHLHLDTPDNSLYDIILGDDNKFVKVDYTGLVAIGTTGVSSYNWIFGTDGITQLPGGLTTSPIGNFIPVSGTVIQQTENEILQVISKGLTGGMTIGWAENPFEPSRVAALSFNANTAEQVQILTGSYTGTVNTWAFDNSGNLTFPDGTTQTTAWLAGTVSSVQSNSVSSFIPETGTFTNTNQLTVSHQAHSADYGFTFTIDYQSPLDETKGVTVGAINTPLILSTSNVKVRANLSTSTEWTFGTDGVLTFPDGSTQTTAYEFVAPPVSSTSTGVAGSLATDASYFYVCTATNAWQRIAWDNTPW